MHSKARRSSPSGSTLSVMTTLAPERPLRPIILGGDIGSYATARAFHEAFGVRTVILAGTRIGPVADSSIVDLRAIPDLPQHMVCEVRRVMDERPESTHMILASVDWWVEELVAHRQELAPAIIPYSPERVIEKVTDKAEFSRICAELNVAHPHTVVVRPSTPLPRLLPEPMVVKAALSGEFNKVEFPGKSKVEFFDHRADLEKYLERVSRAGYHGDFVVQEHLPGGDDSMAAVNAFYGPDGSAHFFVFGRVLLEEHTPNGLGNSVGQITGSDPDHPAVLAARRILDELGWIGFANFDLKTVNGQDMFLELNPRVGRSGYAVTAAGFNVAEYYVRAFVDGAPAPNEPAVPGEGHLFTVVPTALLSKYAYRWRPMIRQLKRQGAVSNPYFYRGEKNPRRWFYVAAAMANQFRKFARHHPAGKRRRN